MIGRILKAGKPKILAIALALLLLTASLDWLVGKNVSVAALYILPVMAAAIVVRPLEIVVFFPVLHRETDDRRLQLHVR